MVYAWIWLVFGLGFAWFFLWVSEQYKKGGTQRGTQVLGCLKRENQSVRVLVRFLVEAVYMGLYVGGFPACYAFA